MMESSELITRELKSSDIPLMHELEKLCFDDAWEIQAFEEILKYDGINLGMFDGKLIIAYLLVLRFEDAFHLANLAVRHSYRRKNLARTLFQRIYSEAANENRRHLFLEARPSNEIAIKFYKSEGFESIMSIPEYYPDGEEALLFYRKV